jgi:hypothetical protein
VGKIFFNNAQGVGVGNLEVDWFKFETRQRGDITRQTTLLLVLKMLLFQVIQQSTNTKEPCRF